MSSRFEKERERLIKIAQENPRPCIVCDSPKVYSIGTWVPDKNQRLAAGGNRDTTPIFSFWLCRAHTQDSTENEKLIRQAVLRSVR